MQNHSIYEVKSYFRPDGKIIKVFEPISPNIEKRFVGSVVLQTHEGLFPIEFDFPQEYSSVEECYDKFEEGMRLFIEKEKDKQRIITSNKNNGGNLIIP